MQNGKQALNADLADVLSDFMAQKADEGEGEVEALVRDYQTTQEQLRTGAMQLEQLQTQKAELSRALDEVTGSTGKVYITVGGIIVETSKDKALADIKDKSEFIEVRLNSLTKQFNELKSKEKQLGEQLTQMYKKGQGASGVG